jgi:hypothetical protein
MGGRLKGPWFIPAGDMGGRSGIPNMNDGLGAGDSISNGMPGGVRPDMRLCRDGGCSDVGVLGWDDMGEMEDAGV